jgi:hypothetical protein
LVLVGDFLVMRSTEDFWGIFFGLDFMGKEGEDFAGLEEVSGEGKKKKKRSFRRGLERKYW